MKDLRLYLRLRQDLRDYLLEGVVRAPELAAGELVVDEHRNSRCPVSQRGSVLKSLVEEDLDASSSMNKHRVYVIGSTQPEGQAVSIRSITIQVFPVNGAREEPASREAMISAMGCKCG